jgi:EpsI family protein
MSRGRAIGVVLLLIGSAAIVRAAVPGAPGASHASLGELPYTIQTWKGAEGPPLDAETLRILAADAVLNRVYTAGDDGTPVGLYIAYYARQRPGVSIHSPLHCLPGTGWEVLDVGTTSLVVAGAASGTVRRMIVRKGRRRALVLYWYSLHGRIIANEITSKLTLLADSVRLHRSDAALVRIVVPAGDSVDAANEHGLAFARDLAPRLAHLLD